MSKKNSSLSSQGGILSKDIEELKSISTSVRKDDYDSLKESYALSLDKISMLSRQCDELELKLKDSESAMNELLSSLEYNEEDSTSDVSLESMIEFLNGFNICFVGGRNDMKERLNSMGLYNFIQLTCENDINRLGNFDFMVSMTKFVSHKVFYGALGKLGSDRDKHHYFNGTNLNSLIQSCYEFINRYFDICS